MSTLIKIGTIVGLITFIPLYVSIKNGKIKQNLMTWVLWTALDAIAGISTFLKDGNWLLPVAYSVGAAIACYFIIKAKNPLSWGWFETMILGFVVGCLVIWGISGTRTAIIASSLAMCGAGIPQLIDAIRRPEDNSILIYVGYTTANALSALGGKEWSVEESFYATCGTAYTLLVLLATSRKLLNPISVPRPIEQQP